MHGFINVKNLDTQSLIGSLCFVDKIIHLFSLLFCVVRTVYKFDFRLVIKETSNKGGLVDRRLIRDGKYVFDKSIYFISTVLAKV